MSRTQLCYQVSLDETAPPFKPALWLSWKRNEWHDAALTSGGILCCRHVRPRRKRRAVERWPTCCRVQSALRDADPEGLPWKYVWGVRAGFHLPLKCHILSFKSVAGQLSKFHITKDERIVSKWKVKLIFRAFFAHFSAPETVSWFDLIDPDSPPPLFYDRSTPLQRYIDPAERRRHRPPTHISLKLDTRRGTTLWRCADTGKAVVTTIRPRYDRSTTYVATVEFPAAVDQMCVPCHTLTLAITAEWCSLRSWQISSISLLFHWSPHAVVIQSVNVFLCLPL